MSQLKGLKLATPTYQIVLPSTGESLTMYPFRVQDEKNLLIASETGDQKNMIDAVKGIIDNNIKGLSKPVDKLASYEVEWLFLQLRSKSVGEIATLNIKCDKCEEETKVNVNVEEVSINRESERENIARITESFAVELSDPTIDDVTESFSGEGNDVDKIIDMIARCTKTVYNADETIEVTTAEIEDLKEIYQNLTQDQFTKLQDFYESMPKLSKTIEFKCSSCQAENEITLEGFQSFF